MNIEIRKTERKQRAIRLNDAEKADLHTVAKSILDLTESEAVAMIFTAIAEEYRKNKDSEEINIKIKKG